jgi:5-hydroxyisourate hydrolase-like protein (transthyretin family)
MLTLVVDPADSSTEVDFMVKIVFDEKDLPQPGESFEINLGMVGKQYHHTVDEQDSPTLLLFYSNKKVEKGFYTLKFKWKNYFLTQRYSIPFEKS